MIQHNAHATWITRSAAVAISAAALGNLAEHDGGDVGAGLSFGDEGGDEAVELVGGVGVGGSDGGEAVAHGGEDGAEDGGVEGLLAVEVVVDHRLVEAGAGGDAVDGGGGEAAESELGGGGVEDALTGVGRRGRSPSHVHQPVGLTN
jgi:hypothetical protein